MLDRDAAPHDDRPRGALLLGALLVGVALVLRLYGNRHGLPWMEEPDAEHVGLARALARGTVGPEKLLELQRYPHLLTLVVWGLMETFDGASGVWLGRIVSAVLGAATVVYVFRLGALLRGAAAGLVAAAFATFSFLGVQHAHLVKPHVAVAFFLTAATFHATRAVAGGARRDVVVAGAFGLLAAATLHTGFLVAVPIVVAAALARTGWSPLVMAGLLVLLALPLAYPGLLIAGFEVATGAADSTALLGSHASVMVESLGLAGLRRVPISLLENEPIPVLLATLAVIVGLARRSRWLRLALPGLVLFVVAALLFGRIRSYAPRMLLPVLPPLFALAGVA
ncbi:MAG: glycosyltransferase family 39 protein, partial [Planctomycetota bacterium JB042]